MSTFLCVAPLICFFHILFFSVYNSSPGLGRFVLNIFTLLAAIVNGEVSFISIFECCSQCIRMKRIVCLNFVPANFPKPIDYVKWFSGGIFGLPGQTIIPSANCDSFTTSFLVCFQFCFSYSFL